MSAPERPYSRVYWSIATDDRFETIMPNERHLGTWLKLLMVADMAWPVPAYLPPVPRASVKALASAGLIELRSGSRYIVHGLDAERERRSASASIGASKRWSGRTADAMQTHSDGTSFDMPSTRRVRDEYETSTRESRAPDAAKALYDRTGEYPTVKVLEWLNDLAKEAGAGDVDAGELRLEALLQATPMNGSKRDYLAHIRDLIRAENHAAERAEASAEKARNAAKREPLPDSPVTQQLRDMLRAKDAAERAGAA